MYSISNSISGAYKFYKPCGPIFFGVQRNSQMVLSTVILMSVQSANTLLHSVSTLFRNSFGIETLLMSSTDVASDIIIDSLILSKCPNSCRILFGYFINKDEKYT